MPPLSSQKALRHPCIPKHAVPRTDHQGDLILGHSRGRRDGRQRQNAPQRQTPCLPLHHTRRNSRRTGQQGHQTKRRNYFTEGGVRSLQEVRSEPQPNEILIANMETNHWDNVFTTNERSWTTPIFKHDVVPDMKSLRPHRRPSRCPHLKIPRKSHLPSSSTTNLQTA